MFKEITAKEIKDNLIKSIADEYMLITAGSENGYNMMTASWGFVGEIWGDTSAMAVIRPQRYTMEFVDSSDYFTLSFYGDNKEIHKICGSKSGRDCNKTILTGLTPVFKDSSVYFNEARMVLICRKQYVQQMRKDCFIDTAACSKWYPNDDFHYMVIGKIEKVLVKE